MANKLVSKLSKPDTCLLPVLAKSKQSINELLENEEHIKVDDLLSVARLDPGFSIALLREAGMRQSREVTTLSHAILLLSIPASIALLNKQPVLEKTVRPELAALIKRRYFYQYMTATIARDWSVLRKESENNELFTAGLNHDFIQIILFLCETETALKLNEFTTSSLAELQKKEIELLGCSVDELSSKVAKAWKLPELIRESYKSNHHNPKINGIRLAHELVQWLQTHQSFDYPEALHDSIADYMRVPENKAHRMINRSVINVFRMTHGKFYGNSLIRAFMSHPLKLTKKQRQQPSRKQILQDCLQRLGNDVAKLSIKDMFKLVTNSLSAALDLDYVAFFHFDPTQQHLTRPITVNSGNAITLASTTVSLELNKLFRQMMKKEQLLIIDNDNRHKYLPHLPPAFAALAENDFILIHSFFLNNKATGCFVIAFNNNKAVEFGRALAAYKRICKELKAALVLRAKEQQIKVA